MSYECTKRTVYGLQKFFISYFSDRDAFNSLIPYLGQKKKNSSASDWTAKQPQHVSKQMKGIWTLQGSSGLNIWVYDSGTGYSQKIDASDQETV